MPETHAILAQRTAISRRDFAIALIRAWRSEQGQVPRKDQVAVLYAQYGIETGAGKYCWNFNFGNVKCTQPQAAAGVPYTMLRNVWEILGGQRVTFQPPHPTTWFRAFADAADGMHFYLGALHKRFALAWASVLLGNPEAFAHKLKEMRYYTAPVEEYARGMRAHYNVFMSTKDYEDAIAELDAVPTEPEIPNVASVSPPPQPEEIAGSGPVIHPHVPLTRSDGSLLDPEAFEDADDPDELS